MFLFVYFFVLVGIHHSSTFSIYDAMIDLLQCGCDRESGLNVSAVKVYVKNHDSNLDVKSYYINNAARAIKERSDFDSTQCILIYVMGYNTAYNDTSVSDVRCVFSKITCNGKKSLAIYIEHIAYTQGSSIAIFSELMYQTAVKYTKSIGIAIGKFIESLLEVVSKDLIDVIGHSLGGHMLGYAGDYLKTKSMTLKRIYVTDAAGPCYDNCPQEHVHKGQAEKVIGFHCTNTLGSKINVLDFDFYSNDGESQKGCPPDFILGMAGQKCSHFKCIPIALNPAIKEGIWKATRCGSYSEYENGLCENREMVLAGFLKIPVGPDGIYYFKPSATLDCDEM